MRCSFVLEMHTRPCQRCTQNPRARCALRTTSTRAHDAHPRTVPPMHTLNCAHHAHPDPCRPCTHPDVHALRGTAPNQITACHSCSPAYGRYAHAPAPTTHGWFGGCLC
ncbi:hypothetical protein CPB85DRAFT_1311704 [Mucidula mucida]|nr:hypothetical protein CPB85DRAFT_1311704 [Mucidula mucida]